MKKPKQKPAAKRKAVRRLLSKEPAPAKPLPNWVTETRDELSYVLLITDDRRDGVDDSLECIDLARDEYIALKRHLAERRGYVIPEAANG